jgi:hypothetical protein
MAHPELFQFQTVENFEAASLSERDNEKDEQSENPILNICYIAALA